ncbi:Uncharacterised protein [Sphingobacterium spiritivorum]|uniref:TonB C-terminal domain-containing protein n=2 Tax=Sphingobacterium spiritivorum TaxID=258 RepID=A0A380BCP0_SPHSI|nr:Uncharacterised protein [Sphingobacterium spiritivorum]
MVSATLKYVWRRSKMENNYQLSRIHNYINGLMSKDEMFQLEREALEDPFLQDAIDGYRMQNKVDIGKLSLLQQRLNKRVAEQHQEKGVRFFGWQRLSIASAAAVLFVVSLVFLWMKNYMVQKQSRTVDVELSAGEYSIQVEPIMNGGEAVPAGGWKKLDNYIQKNNPGLEVGGSVTVSFEIDEKGKPYNIRIEQADNDQIANSSKTLLEKGPIWQGKSATLRIVYPSR